MWINKKTVWDSERISQTSGKIFSTIWSNCILEPLRKKCQEICLEKNPSSVVSRTLRWKFLDFRQNFHQVCQNCVSDVRRKTVRIVPDKRRYSCNFRKMSKLFPRIFAKVSSVCQNCCFLAAQRKTTLKKFFFSKKLVLFRSFPTFYQKFQDLPPTFFIRVVKRAFSMSRRTLPGTLDFLLKNFYLTHFPESARTTIGILTNFFQWGRQNCGHGVQNTIPREKFFEKKSFLKFSIRHWGRLFETPGENFAAGFSKLHFSCHEGSLKQKNFLFKTFLQVFCEFEQSNFWTFSKFFFERFLDITFSVSRLTFWKEVSMIS